MTTSLFENADSPHKGCLDKMVATMGGKKQMIAWKQ